MEVFGHNLTLTRKEKLNNLIVVFVFLGLPFKAKSIFNASSHKVKYLYCSAIPLTFKP